MRVTQTQTNFWGGQIATQSQGYADDELYKASSAEITNFVVTPNGGLTRRPGTKFVARSKPNAVALCFRIWSLSVRSHNNFCNTWK